jgi:endo-1,4-beta-mannosidase
MLRFGVNYTPSENWWYYWLEGSPDRVRADFDAIRNLGMDHLRIFCIWSVFQPNPNWVSPRALSRLREMLDLADEFELDVQVTVLNGWLSGFLFVPDWAQQQDFFLAPQLVESQTELITQVIHSVADHPRFLGVDLGNELGVTHLKASKATRVQADAWQTALLSHCESLAPGKIHVNGVDHQHTFQGVGFTPQVLANTGTMSAVHAWFEFTGAREKYQPLDWGSVGLGRYCLELSSAFAQDPSRKVWLQEIGVSQLWMPESDLIPFIEQSLHHAAECPALWGITWWCSHDIDRKFGGFHELEYDLGLLTIDNKIKPSGTTLQKLLPHLHKAREEGVSATPFEVSTEFITQRGCGWPVAEQYFKHAEAHGFGPIQIKPESEI